jgi:hypothetical protein
LSQIKNAVGARAAGLAAIQVILIDCEEDRTLRAVLVGIARGRPERLGLYVAATDESLPRRWLLASL